MSAFDYVLAPLALVGVVGIATGIVVWHAWREYLKDNGLI